VYVALTAWEQRHVAHHLAELRGPAPAAAAAVEPEPTVPKLAA
jgi:hypothetical protein